MNVLLADDERLVRSSLRSMLQELNMPIHVIGEARNGQDMVDMVGRMKPDLVFVDIRMPKLNGLEGIAQGKVVSPDTKWIILSGFSDFTFAQEALRLGTSNYLLKPVSTEQLEACMINVMKDHHKHVTILNREFEHMLVSFIHGTRPTDEASVDSLFHHFRFKGTVFFIDSCLTEQEKTKLLHPFAAGLQTMIEKMSVCKEVRSALTTLRDGNLAVFWAWEAGKDRAGGGDGAGTEGRDGIAGAGPGDGNGVAGAGTGDGPGDGVAGPGTGDGPGDGDGVAGVGTGDGSGDRDGVAGAGTGDGRGNGDGVAGVGPGVSAAKAIITAFDEHVCSFMARHGNDQFSITAVQTEACPGISAVLRQIGEVQSLSSLRALLSIGKVWGLGDFRSLDQRTGCMGLSLRLEKVVEHYREQDFVKYTRELSNMEQEMLSAPAIAGSIGRFLSSSIPCGLRLDQPPCDWIKQLQELGEKRLAAPANEEHVQRDHVQRVMTYVVQNYMKDIGIAQIASEINVTPNYLSSLFHKKAGTTFIKYVTKIRILKAKELLLTQPSLKIQAIAEEVGYYSTRHFTKLFKEHFDCYPSELREKYK